MLYVKFDIGDTSKYADFEKIYRHMVMVRQPGFKFEKEPEPEIDWEQPTDDLLETLRKLDEAPSPEEKRYDKLFPDYADEVLQEYGRFSYDHLQILNYLEYGFEVDLLPLGSPRQNQGIIQFSTGSYPFGGLDRLLVTLRAFELLPTECYNGFVVFQFKWVAHFVYETIELPEATERHKKRFR